MDMSIHRHLRSLPVHGGRLLAIVVSCINRDEQARLPAPTHRRPFRSPWRRTR